MQSRYFKHNLDELQGDQALTLGLALEDCAFERPYEIFDITMVHKPCVTSPSVSSLAWFLFTLLKRLQDVGTCPAVDWNRYRDVLSHV